MTALLWVLGIALVALVVTRVALQWHAGGRSPLHALARDYLGEQLTAHGIADKVPARCIAEIAERYSSAVDLRPLGRIAAASELMRRIDAAVAVIAEWVRDGREFPRSVAEMALPGLGVPDTLQELDAPKSDD
jgi:hypothetical protein